MPVQLTKTKEGEAGRPAWSPDGSRIAVLVDDEDKFYAYDLAKLAVVPAAGGAPTILTPALDRAVANPSWTADGQALIFAVEDDRARWIGRVSAGGGAVEALDDGGEWWSHRSPGGVDGGVAVLASTPGEPAEIYALESGVPRSLSHQNDKLRDELELAMVSHFTSKSKDGTLVHGLLTRPAGAKG